MLDTIAVISTNLFRTYIIKRFVSLFFTVEDEKKSKEKMVYLSFYLVTTITHLLFHFPPVNVVVNLLMIYIITSIYDGKYKKKLLITFLIYGVNMFCDALAIFSFSNYTVGRKYSNAASYITVLLISICEFVLEKYVIKEGKSELSLPCWKILICIPIVSMAIILVLVMNNLNNQFVIILVSAGILLINMLIFYLYDVLLEAYIRLEENSVYENQAASYAHQIDVLMQSEKKINALRHDMKHHLNELLLLAQTDDNQKKMIDYIQSMQMFFQNTKEYVYSGNKEFDSILNYMLNQAQDILNEVEYKISIPQDMGISAFDLNVILGNLMENAIHAAKDSEQKWLSVMIRYEKGMLLINIGNSYGGEINK